jgi:hypothetical protein
MAVKKIQQLPKELRSYLSDAFSELMNNRCFIDALPGRLPPDKTSQSRLPIILNRIDSISIVHPEIGKLGRDQGARKI